MVGETREQMARECLAAEYERAGSPSEAQRLRSPKPLNPDGDGVHIVAIRAMLAFAAPPVVEDSCPFCGGAEIGWTMLAGHKFAASYCQTCNARGPTVPFEMKREPIDETTAPAKAAWAKRRAPAPDEFREVLRALIESWKAPEPYIAYESDLPVPDEHRDWSFAHDVELLDETYALALSAPPLPTAGREEVEDRAREMLQSLIGNSYSDTTLRVATDWLKQEARLTRLALTTEGAGE